LNGRQGSDACAAVVLRSPLGSALGEVFRGSEATPRLVAAP
jgi:hypothetical protein